nr:hypothetical protein [Tanacetum cinerariifolium]
VYEDEIDASDCGPEDVPATPLLNALRLRLPHKLLLMKIEALRLIDGLNANGRRTAHSSHINISRITGLSFEKRESSRSAYKVWNNMLNYMICVQIVDTCICRLKGDVKIDVFDFLSVAEFAEHAVMAARAAGEFSKAENDALGLQLAIDRVFLNFSENKANALGLL